MVNSLGRPRGLGHMLWLAGLERSRWPWPHGLDMRRGQAALVRWPAEKSWRHGEAMQHGQMASLLMGGLHLPPLPFKVFSLLAQEGFHIPNVLGFSFQHALTPV